MWSNEIRQVVEVFQETVHLDQVIKNPVDYVAKYDANLRSAGPTLAFLGLAISDEKSPFGWKPTSLLMYFIAERKRKKSRPLYEVDLLEQLLTDYVFSYEADRGEGSAFAGFLLEGLGVIQYDGDTYWVTEDLHNLFHNAYYNKREKDGLSCFPNSWGRPDGLQKGE